MKQLYRMKDEQAAVLLKKLESGYALPSLSAIAVKLIELASDDACSVKELAELIEKDPSLTVRVLKLANSAAFRSRFPATTLHHAITRIGFHQLRILALSLSLRDTFPMGKSGRFNYEQFWRISLYQGLLARSLSRELKGCDPDEAFVAGLTLEIGLLVFYDLFVKKVQEGTRLDWYPLASLLDSETQQFGINHRDVGEIALSHWKFPEAIVLCQRSYEAGEAAAMPPLARICSMASELSALICHPNANFQQVFQSVESSFDVGQDILSDAVVTTFREVDEIAEALTVQVTSEKDSLFLMEKAHRELSRLSEQVLQAQSAGSGRELPSFETLRPADQPQASDTVAKTLEAVAHEIRNPLTAVGGFARRLAKTMDQTSAGWKYVEVILSETKRLEEALNTMSQNLRSA